MYRNIKIFAFKVLQECSSLASRNGAVPIFFGCVVGAYIHCQVS